jgi:signal peptidase II
MVRPGILVAIAVVVLDQASKIWIAAEIGLGQGVPVTGFFNLVHVLNTGISFSLFQAGELSRWIFTILALAVAVGLIVWLRRATSMWTAVALGGIIGGAVGNTIDRVRIGAVVDFLDFNAAGFHWPAFNVADSAIVVGAVMILAEGLFSGPRRGAKGDDHRH